MTPPAPRRSRRAVAPVTDPSRVSASAGTATHDAPTVAAPVAELPIPAPAAEPSVEREKAPEREPTSPDRAPVFRKVGRLSVVLGLVGVLTLALAGVFAVQAHQLRSTDSASNLALVDTSLTNEAISSVSASLNRVFTYDYASPEATQQAASELLVGDASSQYKTLFDALQSKASGQQLTLKTTTVLGGVTTLTPDSARLLVFLDQSSTRASDSSSSTAAAQLDVAAVKRDGVWKISEIRPL